MEGTGQDRESLEEQAGVTEQDEGMAAEVGDAGNDAAEQQAMQTCTYTCICVMQLQCVPHYG